MDIILRDVTVNDASALAHVLITGNEAAFRGRVPDRCLEFTEAESAANWHKFLATEGVPEGDVFVAACTASGEVVGYIWGGLHDSDSIYRGEIRAIYILPAFQGRGIGRWLICHAAAHFTGRGIDTMRVEVLRVNPNRLFYERMGAIFVEEHPYDWDGSLQSSCVYGWRDIGALQADRCKPSG
jgi:ribosomal protein S18 acetylase RimI-like enzyme